MAFVPRVAAKKPITVLGEIRAKNLQLGVPAMAELQRSASAPELPAALMEEEQEGEKHVERPTVQQSSSSSAAQRREPFRRQDKAAASDGESQSHKCLVE